MSDKEAEEVGAMLAATLESHFEYIDQFLWLREKTKTGASTQAPVWSNLDAEELESLIRLWKKWGKRNTYVAEAGRAMIEFSDYLTVGILFIPRIRETVRILQETRTPPKRRGEKVA